MLRQIIACGKTKFKSSCCNIAITLKTPGLPLIICDIPLGVSGQLGSETIFSSSF